MLKYSLLVLSLLLTGCNSVDYSSLEKRVDNLEAEVIALRAENHALASALGLYELQDEFDDYEFSDEMK